MLKILGKMSRFCDNSVENPASAPLDVAISEEPGYSLWLWGHLSDSQFPRKQFSLEIVLPLPSSGWRSGWWGFETIMGTYLGYNWTRHSRLLSTPCCWSVNTCLQSNVKKWLYLVQSCEPVLTSNLVWPAKQIFGTLLLLRIALNIKFLGNDQILKATCIAMFFPTGKVQNHPQSPTNIALF